MIKNKILVIDDDNLLLDALESFLTYNQFDILTHDNSNLIFETINAFKPELIILDINLGNADGRLICNELKSNINTSEIPIILLTGLGYDDISEIDCSADAIIGKPFESSTLLFNIQQLLIHKGN